VQFLVAAAEVGQPMGASDMFRAVVIAITTMILAPSAASAIVITDGSIQNTRNAGSVDIRGNGFSLVAVEAFGGGFGPGGCSESPVTCQPGFTMGLHTFWSGGDLPGTATFNGRTFAPLGCANCADSAIVQTDGNVVLPAFAAAQPLDGVGGRRGVILEAPFTFQGSFIHSPERLIGGDERFTLPLTGQGLATVTVALAEGGDIRLWELNNVRFDFATPEPGTLLLVGAGPLAVGLRPWIRRRRLARVGG